jgi:tRNA(Ile2) C34 agmatinyltransferase TiaS
MNEELVDTKWVDSAKEYLDVKTNHAIDNIELASHQMKVINPFDLNPICGCGGRRWKTKVKGVEYECRKCGEPRYETRTDR